MTAVSGLRSGLRSVLRSGLNPSDSSVLAGVTLDASGRYRPSSSAEWATVLAAAGIASGGPSALYLCQDASGNLADAVGTFPLTASGTGTTYMQPVSGWSAKAVAMTSGSTGLFQSTDAGLPDIATTSMLMLAYAQPTTTASTRDIMGGGTAATRILAETTATSGVPRIMCAGNAAVGAVNTGAATRPWTLQINRTAGSAALYTDAERIVPTFGTTAAGKSISIGNFVAGTATCLYALIAVFFGAAAELSTAQVRSLHTTLGWTPLF